MSDKIMNEPAKGTYRSNIRTASSMINSIYNEQTDNLFYKKYTA